MFSYGKIFGSMFTGSMVGSGPVVLSLWAYVIANAQPPGVVELNPRLLAYIIGCKEDEIVAAIEVLCSPDKSSRTEDMEGRRLIQEGTMQYRVVTWAKYNKVRNDEARRAQNREAQARYRKKVGLTVSIVSQPSAESAHREGEGDRDQEGDQKVQSAPAPRRDKSVEKPDDVDDQTWADWTAHRKKKRSTITKTVIDSLRKEATMAGESLAEAMRTSVAMGWSGYKSDWARRGTTTGVGKPSFIPKITPKDFYAETTPCDENGFPLNIGQR